MKTVIKKHYKLLILIMIITAALGVYIYLVVFGLNIPNPRKQMAKPITLNGEFVYIENHTKEMESLVISYEWRNGHTYTSYKHYGKYHKNEGIGDGPKCLVEIHSNGWMKIFYATYEQIGNTVYSNYDYVGRKYLLPPFQYKRLLDMAEKVRENNVHFEEIVAKNRTHYPPYEYPAYYSYGVKGMPYDWENGIGCEGRLFYNGHWYNENEDETMDDFRTGFIEKNKYISGLIAKEKEENLYRCY